MLFGDLLGLSGTVITSLVDFGVGLVWIEGYDAEGSPITTSYVADSDTTLIGDTVSKYGAAIGTAYSSIQFATGELNFSYVCEYCPP